MLRRGQSERLAPWLRKPQFPEWETLSGYGAHPLVKTTMVGKQGYIAVPNVVYVRLPSVAWHDDSFYDRYSPPKV